jgi:hypothetical protein
MNAILTMNSFYGWMHTTIYTTNDQKMKIFKICWNLMHHDGYLENISQLKFAINVWLCCEIGTHMNNSIMI